MKHTLKQSLAITLAIASITIGASARSPEIVVGIEPAAISLGQAAQLTVTVQGEADYTPNIPAVNGLSFEPVGQSRQIRIINGAMSANVSHTFMVIPGREGIFTIPGIKVGNGRDIATSQPVALEVLPAGRSAATHMSHGQGTLPAPKLDDNGEDRIAPDPNSFGFLRIVSPKKTFRVGEMVPVELRAYFRAGVELRVDGLPRLNSDAFTMNKLGNEPARGQQVIDGVPFTVFSWPTAITAVKAGDYELSVEIPTTVTVRQQAARPRARGRSAFDDVFDDPFFNQFFGRATQKQVVLRSQAGAVKILPLPVENRPEEFSGAVGTFDITAEAMPIHATAGDPVMFQLKISGSGNFDRVTTPVFEQSDSWKPYQPTVKFSPADSAGLSGEKTFERALVPLQSGTLEIPALAFSFFDPVKDDYVTRHTTPIQIKVAPAPVATTTPLHAGPATASGNTASPDAPVASRPQQARAPLSIPSRLGNAWIIAIVLLVAAATSAATWFIRRKRWTAVDPVKPRLSDSRATVSAQMQTMESAVERGSALDFFTAARRALLIQLGLRWNLPPESITPEDIHTRMNGEAGHYWPVLEAAEQVIYTGRACTPTELRHWHDSVRRALARLA